MESSRIHSTCSCKKISQYTTYSMLSSFCRNSTNLARDYRFNCINLKNHHDPKLSVGSRNPSSTQSTCNSTCIIKGQRLTSPGVSCLNRNILPCDRSFALEESQREREIERERASRSQIRGAQHTSQAYATQSKRVLLSAVSTFFHTAGPP